MFTIVASSTTISCARPMSARISQRRRLSVGWVAVMCRGSWCGSGGRVSTSSASVAQNWRHLSDWRKPLRFGYAMCVMPRVRSRLRRPLRRDAERNRQRILDAARVVFAERGLSGSLDDIARQAGVGVGTVYRRFPDKELLIDALFEERIEEIADVARAAADHPDPWEGLVDFLTRTQELQSRDRGLKELVLGGSRGAAARSRPPAR